MSTRPVHWSEGMLVLPQHFQAAQENLFAWVRCSEDWQSAYNYGLRGVTLNLEALTNYEARVSRLQARFKDGTIVGVPDNASLSTLDLRPAFKERTEVYLHIVLPEIVPGKTNASRDAHNAECRFLVDTEDFDDRNRGGNPRPIDTQRFNIQLLASGDRESPRGYESLPLARLKRSQRADAVPELDEEYIPPVLACDGWEPLRQSVLLAVTAQLGSFIRSQADYLRTHGGWGEANQPQIRKSIMKLNAVNSSYPYLTQLVEGRGVHPFVAYTELCRLVGQLSIFRDNWQPPELPVYDHDDLGRIFRQVMQEINAVFDERQSGPTIQRFPFQGVQEWMEVGLDPRWLRGNYGFYVAVRSELTPERLEAFFSQRWLDWKLGSSRTILQIYLNGEAGVSLARVVGVHQSLPALANVTYFRVDPRGRYWDQVTESRTLALKVNEQYVRSDFVGQSSITVIDPRNNPRDLSLELFVVENE